ncbi:MAG: hypothetical protein ACLRMJ_09385 [Alistipes finegoldii]
MQQPKVSVTTFLGRCPTRSRTNGPDVPTQALNSRYLFRSARRRAEPTACASGFDEYIPARPTADIVRHQRRDGRRTARDRDEGDREIASQRPKSEDIEKTPRIHAQELENSSEQNGDG